MDEGQAAVLAGAAENAAGQFAGRVDYGQGIIYVSPGRKDGGLTQELVNGLVDSLMAAGLVKTEDADAVKRSLRPQGPAKVLEQYREAAKKAIDRIDVGIVRLLYTLARLTTN
jgi:hypothetical protein